MKISKSQLFLFFVLFWLGLAWLGLVFALAGIFYKEIFVIYLVAGFLAFLILLSSNFKLLKEIRPGFISAVMIIIIAILIFSYFSSPTVFSGRDQGSLSEAAIRLSQNHQLKFSFEAEKDFFDIYGPGRALNFPGFSYTRDGALMTQFPAGYISWLAIFYSLMGINGLIAANAVLFLIFLISFYFLLRYTLPVSSSLVGILLILTSFVFSWLFKFTLSENMALALIWFAIWSFVVFVKNQDKFYALCALLSMGFLLFVRIEALAFLFMMGLVTYLNFRQQDKSLADLVGKLTIRASYLIGLLFIISIYLNREFFTTVAKAVLRPAQDASGIISISGIFSSTAYALKIFYAYNIIAFLILGAFGIFYFYNKDRLLLIPFVIVLPSLLYIFFPNISSDHPWMLRRFSFAVIPASIYYAILLLHHFLKRKVFFYFLTAFLFVLNLQIFLRYLPVIPHKRLLSEIESLSNNFEETGLILVDREATGDGWSMISGPLNFLYGRQAVYFFNPADLDKIDKSKYSGIYFIIPNHQLPTYEDWGILEKMSSVKDYAISNNFLGSGPAGQGNIYPASVTLPHQQALTTEGKIYKLNK